MLAAKEADRSATESVKALLTDSAAIAHGAVTAVDRLMLQRASLQMAQDLGISDDLDRNQILNLIRESMVQVFEVGYASAIGDMRLGLLPSLKVAEGNVAR